MPRRRRRCRGLTLRLVPPARRLRVALADRRRDLALAHAVERGVAGAALAVVLALNLLEGRPGPWATLWMIVDPLRAAAAFAVAAGVFPGLVSPRRLAVGDAVAAAALFTALIPATKLLFDGPTPPVEAIGMDRRFDGVWFDPGVLLGVFALSAAYNLVRAGLWAVLRRRRRGPGA